jgi:5'(3')-deoxyribonucleotidase
MTKIAVDVDGVIADLIDVWLAWYNRDWNDSLEFSQLEDWDIHKFVKPECGKGIYDYLQNPKIYDDVEPIFWAYDGIEYLRKLDLKIAYITHATNGHTGRKRNWLLQYGFLKPEDEYLESIDKNVSTASILIDDYIENVKAFQKTAVLFKQPWNMKHPWKYEAFGWFDAVMQVKKILKENGL